MRVSISASLAALTLIAAGCGGAATAGSSPSGPPAETMPSMAPMMMGNPDATPAQEVAGATIEIGTFAPFTDAVGDGTAGEVALARHDGGTTLTVSLRSLPPASDFIGHVHTGACADGGGAHYRHDPSGSDLPPNEIHIAFSSDSDGTGFMTVENATEATHAAASVVIHAVAGDTFVCADLIPTDR
jgi:hypothetical protein